MTLLADIIVAVIAFLSIASLGVVSAILSIQASRSAVARDEMLERLVHEALQHVDHELAVKRHELTLERLAHGTLGGKRGQPHHTPNPTPPPPGVAVRFGPDGDPDA